MIRILVADDHAIVRAGVKQIIADMPDVKVTAEASRGSEVIELITNSTFDLILLDIAMPGQSGIEVLKQIKSLKPELPVLMLSIYPEEQYAIRALRAGSAGYLTKESAPAELIKAIRSISGKKKYITASLADSLADAVSNSNKDPLHNNLSDREFQVMCMLANGKTVSEIAKELNLSPKTISTHRTRLMRKMNMKKNSQLNRYAREHELIY
jgi:DNA-binding NarL/FixJ family response regulator